jgi:hypothetical protein
MPAILFESPLATARHFQSHSMLGQNQFPVPQNRSASRAPRRPPMLMCLANDSLRQHDQQWDSPLTTAFPHSRREDDGEARIHHRAGQHRQMDLPVRAPQDPGLHRAVLPETPPSLLGVDHARFWGQPPFPFRSHSEFRDQHPARDLTPLVRIGESPHLGDRPPHRQWRILEDCVV